MKEQEMTFEELVEYINNSEDEFIINVSFGKEDDHGEK